ncbi:kinase-like domain-containing protein [Tanacetum coccineum]
MNSPQAIIFSSSSSCISFLFYGLAVICLTSSTVCSSGGGNETDYLALLSFKSKITHDPYQVLSSWNHSLHFCDWSGVTCGKRHKRVTVLSLYQKGLEGSLSPHVGNLSFLRKLYLDTNNFQGTIPYELGRLSRLRRLYLPENNFSGVIPPNLSNCSNLELLYLLQNNLAGSIPKEMSLLSKLSGFQIGINKLTGGIPPFLGNITWMEVFSAAGNPLGGSISDTLGLWKSLTIFQSGECNLYGSIPHSIFNLSFLVEISLPGNHLTGSIPSKIGNQLPNLEFLQLRDNELTGVLAPSISNCSKLRILDMSDNNFSGKLTIDFSKVRYIKGIFIANANFHARGEADDMRFIDSMKNCTRLNILSLSNCNLVGMLPISIDNRLSGKIPKQILQLPSLTISLDLSQNNLSGSVPSEIKDLKMLSYLDLSYNSLSGTITSSLDECNSLTMLNLSDNIFHGIIPSSLSSLRALKKKHNRQPSQSSGNERFLKVSYNELLKATGGFTTENLIGEGGFSSVYKGILDANDDRFVAIKVLHLLNRGAHKSFVAECEAWRNIRHRNLLKIITSCSSVDFQGNDFKALMYEYMPNGSVHDWLHSSANTSKLNLLQRINILRDVATALDYLHIRCETTIVHSDLKPSNILLDADMVAHVGDFGLARLLGTDLNQNSSTGVKGTIGYAPPEYGIGSEMTSSGDVYSFGILLLELMTGKKPTDDMFNEGLSIHKFASMALPDHVVDVIDGDASVLQSKEANAKKVEECLAATIKIGVSCSVDSPPQRMKIEVVVIELQRILDVLQNI